MTIRGYISSAKVVKRLKAMDVTIYADTNSGKRYIKLDNGDRVSEVFFSMKNWIGIWSIAMFDKQSTSGLKGYMPGTYFLKDVDPELAAAVGDGGTIIVQGSDLQQVKKLFALLGMKVNRWHVDNGKIQLVEHPKGVNCYSISWETAL